MKKLIVIDGLDGSGKATQTDLLTKKLTDVGKDIVKITYPNYENESSALVKMYLNGEISDNPSDINAYAAASFYACDRYIGYQTEWKNDYLDGKIIIADRYVSSNAIHQMVKLPMHEWDDFLKWLYDYEFVKLGLPREDKLIYLDMDPLISQKLINSRYGKEDKKDIHEKNIKYLLNCQKAAHYAAKKLGWYILKCDDGECPLSIAKIEEKIYNLIYDIVK
ncbi:MAG: deoxynucleoside kinase [Oscillospiraceae bacterium]|nr:deoxynucleoside kinase [Oscillospiraceae bacterium]